MNEKDELLFHLLFQTDLQCYCNIIPLFGNQCMEWIDSIKKVLGLTGNLSHYQILEVRLDVICHFIVGTILAIYLAKKNFSFFARLMIVSLIALAKEYIDSFTLGFKLQEAIIDFLSTVVFVFFQGLVIAVGMLKNKK